MTKEPGRERGKGVIFADSVIPEVGETPTRVRGGGSYNTAMGNRKS